MVPLSGLKLKAPPTSPRAKVAPPWSVPLFVPAASRQSPSPRHQPTKPEGGGVQFVGSSEAVRTIVAEITVPSRMPAVRIRLRDVIRSFILNLPHDGLHAIVLLIKWADRKSTRLNSSHLGISYAV